MTFISPRARVTGTLEPTGNEPGATFRVLDGEVILSVGQGAPMGMDRRRRDEFTRLWFDACWQADQQEPG